MDLAKVHWEAVHSDKKINSDDISEEYKPYKEITRGNLQYLRFYKLGDSVPCASFKRPDNLTAWNIKWRLRTQVEDGSGAIIERFWIIEENNPDKQISIIRQTEEIEKFTDYSQCERKPIVETILDQL